MIIAASAVILSASSCRSPFKRFNIKPTGTDTTIVFANIPATYSGIDISSVCKVRYTDEVEYVTVVADKGIAPYVKVRCKDGELSIALSGVSLNDVLNIDVDVPVSSRPLEEVDVSGASSFVSDVPLSGGTFSLDVSGVSKAEVEVDAARFIADISGASVVKAAGKAEKLVLDISGASKFRGTHDGGFSASEAVVDISGASSASSIIAGRVTGDVSGASKLNVIKGTDISAVEFSGASHISIMTE